MAVVPLRYSKTEDSVALTPEPKILSQEQKTHSQESKALSQAQANEAFEPDKVEINGNVKPKTVSSPDLDVILPAESQWTVVCSEPVKLRMTENGPGAEKPRTVASVLLETVRKAPTRIALGE